MNALLLPLNLLFRPFRPTFLLNLFAMCSTLLLLRLLLLSLLFAPSLPLSLHTPSLIFSWGLLLSILCLLLFDSVCLGLLELDFLLNPPMLPWFTGLKFLSFVLYGGIDVLPIWQLFILSADNCRGLGLLLSSVLLCVLNSSLPKMTADDWGQLSLIPSLEYNELRGGLRLSALLVTGDEVIMSFLLLLWLLLLAGM